MQTPTIGRVMPGYSVPVINERSVRAAAGMLFLIGAIAWGAAFHTGSAQALKPFGVTFMVDMLIRLTAGERWAPSLVLGSFVTRRQAPEWVGAPQKEFAWWLGLGIAMTSCLAMGFLGAPLPVILSLCGLCLSLLFLETAFGICVGCWLQSRLSRSAPQRCPGDSCATEH